MTASIKPDDVKELVSNYGPVGLRAVAAAYVPKQSSKSQSNHRDDHGAIKAMMPSGFWTADTD